MKKIFLLLIIITGCIKNIYSQSATPCASMVPICIAPGQPFTYSNTTNVFSAETGPAYGCLCTTPNPSWFYMQSSAAGPMTFNLTQSSTNGGPPDLPLDFVAWGPFSTTVNACSNLTGNCGAAPSGTTCGDWFGAIPNPTCTGGIVDCSYDISATEAMTLNPTAAGQIFIVMVTNFSNTPGYISFDQTSGAATDCSVTCPPTNFTMTGTVESNGANQPSGSTVVCNEPFFINPPNLSTSIPNPLKDELTPCIAINYSPYVSNLDAQGTVSIFQNGAQTYTLCPSCPESIGDAGASPGSIYNWYSGFNDPTKSHDFEFCNTAGTTGPTTVTLRNCWTNSVIAGPAVWNTSSASCFTLTSPANTNIGTATYSITPAFGNPGLVDSNSGWAHIDPSLMVAGNTYTVTYTFNNGVCGVLNGYYIFTIPSAPVVSVPSQSVCSGSTVNAVSFTTTPAGGNITWTNNNTNIGIAAIGTTGIASYIAPVVSSPETGTFAVVSSLSGCTNAPVTFSITINPVPVANAGTTGTLTCANTTTVLTGSGGGTYSWTGPGIVAGATTATPTINLPGTYSLVVTSAGCPSTVSTVAVSQNTSVVTVTAAASNSLTCNTTTANIIATTTATPVSYTWTGTGITSGTNTNSITVNQPGTFNYTVTNTNNGCLTTGSQTILQNTIAPVVSSTTNSLTCASATVNASISTTTTPVSYTWTGTGITGSTTTNSISVNQPGVFNYTVTNTDNSCATSGSLSVLQNTNAPVVTQTTNTLSCINATVNASLSTTATPVSYTWTGTGITGSTTSNSITVNQPGSFNYTVTNTSNGCLSTGSLAVGQNTTAPVVTGSSSSITCASSTASIIVTTSSTPVSYNWSGAGITAGNGTATITVNQAGTYNYTVTNTNTGCITVGSQSVVQNTLAPTITTTKTQLNCINTTANAIISTTTTPVSYNWSGSGIISGTTSNSITVNQPGSYSYTVTNTDNGCTRIGSLSIIQNTTTPVVTSTTNTLTCSNTTVTVSISTSAAPVNYAWSGTGIIGPTFTNSISVNQPGTFNYTVTNSSNGCVTTGSLSVTQNTTAPVVTSTTNTLTCTNTLVTASLNTTATPVSYTWTGAGITGSTTSNVGSSRVDLQACKLEYSIVSPK